MADDKDKQLMEPKWDSVVVPTIKQDLRKLAKQADRGEDVEVMAANVGGAGGDLTIRGGLGTPGHRDGVIRIQRPDGRDLVIIYPDGVVEFGPDYDPDETARAFWQVLGELRP